MRNKYSEVEKQIDLKIAINALKSLRQTNCIKENDIYSKKIDWVQNQLRQELGAILTRKELGENDT